MKAFTPFLILLSVVLAIGACIEVGWLYSVLTLGVACCILYMLYTLYKKASRKEATERDIKAANVTRIAIVAIAIGLIFFGILVGGIGLLTAKTDGYYLQKCGWCGGTGRLSSGEICGLCDGAGGVAGENLVYDDSTWIGILMAAFGAILYSGASFIKDTIGVAIRTAKKHATSNVGVSSAVSSGNSSSDVHRDSTTQHAVYMMIEGVRPIFKRAEPAFEIHGVVIRGEILGQNVVIVKSHTTGETQKFRVAGSGLKGRVGDRTCFTICAVEDTEPNVTVGDSLYI